MLYRLATETKPNLATLAGVYFDGFTILQGKGYWKGQAEPSTIIEVETDDDDSVRRLAEDIRTTNNQEAVMVTSLASQMEMIVGKPSPVAWVDTINEVAMLTPDWSH